LCRSNPYACAVFSFLVAYAVARPPTPENTRYAYVNVLDEGQGAVDASLTAAQMLACQDDVVMPTGVFPAEGVGLEPTGA
jgi:hypothetical protein